MSDDYELLTAPWHGEMCDTPLRAGDSDRSRDQRTVRLLDQACEHLTTAYIAESMGDGSRFGVACDEIEAFFARMSTADLRQMVMLLVSPHATDRARFATQQIPDTVPTDWTKGSTS